MNPLAELARIIQETAEQDPVYREVLIAAMAEEAEKDGAK